MRAREKLPGLLIFLSLLFVTSCLLPGMIPFESEPEGPMPVMEENTDTVLDVLRGDHWHLLQALAEEQYTEEDYARPGRLTYTVNVTDDQPVYFSYGWCAVDEETLVQNFGHMRIRFTLNGEALEEDVIHNLTFTAPNNMLCADFGVLITEWPDGDYKLEAVITFLEPINDGLDDFEAGDYIFEYNVEVNRQKEGGQRLQELIHEPVL